MQETVLLSMPITQLEKIVIDAVNACLDIRQARITTPLEPDTLLTVKDAAKFLAISESTIYTLIAKGELPVTKRYRRFYFSEADLITWQAQKEVSNG